MPVRRLPRQSALWISEPDGSHLVLIAVWPRTDTTDVNLQWTPDGRYVSFDHEDESGAVAASEASPQLAPDYQYKHTIYRIAIP